AALGVEQLEVLPGPERLPRVIVAVGLFPALPEPVDVGVVGPEDRIGGGELREAHPSFFAADLTVHFVVWGLLDQARFAGAVMGRFVASTNHPELPSKLR